MNLSISEISRETGLSKAYISELFSRKKDNPTYKTLVKLGDALNTVPDLEKIISKFQKQVSDQKVA